MDEIEKKLRYNRLLTIYSSLLSDIEKEDMVSYYEDDLSLSEIAANRKVSRNAVFTSLKKAEAKLDKFESVLKIERQKLNLIERLKMIETSSDPNGEIKKLLEDIENGI